MNLLLMLWILYNVVEIDNDYVNNIIYYGRGAGRYVTASAVVSDIMKTHQVERWSHDYEDCKHVYLFFFTLIM